MDSILKNLKHYFETTPREKVLADWAAAKEATRGVKSPTIGEFFEMQSRYSSTPVLVDLYEPQPRKVILTHKINTYKISSVYSEKYGDNELNKAS